MVFNLGITPSVANHFLRSLRDPVLQKDRVAFRKNIERLGEIMAYEISKKMDFRQVTIKTPLGEIETQLMPSNPVLITVLRAGLPYFTGFQNFYTESDCGFMGAYRKEGEEIAIELNYLAAPDLNNKVLILIDPMLATGKSVIRSLEALKKHGTPAHVHVAALVASPQGIDFVKKHITSDYSLWTFSVDHSLNVQSYIVPGLGDAGDLCYGDKL